MNEELIQKIRLLLVQLEAERNALEQGSTAYRNKSKVIDSFTAGLSKLSGSATANAREIKQLTAQYERFFQALASGESIRTRLGGGFRPYTQKFQASFQAVKDKQAEYEEYLEPVNPRVGSRTSAGVFVVQGNDQLKQSAEEAKKTAKETAAEQKRQLRETAAEQAKWARIAKQEARDLATYEKAQAKARVDAEKAAQKAINDARKKAHEEEKTRQKQLLEIAKQNLESSLPGGQASSSRLDRMASRINPGFTRDTIQSVSTEGESQITKIKYGFRDVDGIFKSATFTVDRFGTVLADTQRRFQTFGTAIRKDIIEVLKWSVAVGVVYGPLQKLSELTDTMIRNQAALADITVTLGSATQSVSEIFASAADVARETGENLDEVLEAYNFAYRATGEIADSTLRFATANKLLEDSLILSKLSTLEEAEAIDTLSAALKQSGKGLDEGRDLLDKWVKVTKVANVDLTTLAIGFSVLGDAAEAAKISNEDLAAIIATISETSSSSGREVANAAKAIVSGFQSDQARKELAALGISLEDSKGNVRAFLDVVNELRDLTERGIISEDQFSKLTLAIGGGTRRQAVVSAFISNSGKIADITKAQQDSAGASAEALGKKLDTVQTSITRLGNSFQELAQSLGEEGGLLDIFKLFTDIAGTLISSLAQLTEVAGKAGPAVYAALGISTLFGGKQGKGSVMVKDFGSRMAESYYLSRLGGNLDPDLARAAGNRFGGSLAKAAPYALGAAGVAIPAIQNFAQGNIEQGGANLIGGSVGAAIGSYLGGPAGMAIGGTLGSAIAESFVNTVKNFKPEFQDIFSDIFVPEAETETGGQAYVSNAQKQAIEALEKATGANSPLGKFLASVRQGVYNTAGSLAGGSSFQGVNEIQTLLIQLGQMRQSGSIPEEEYQRIIKLFQEANIRPVEQGLETGGESYIGPTSALRIKREDELRKMLGEGKIGIAPYRRGMESLEGFSALAGRYAEATGFEGKDQQQMFEQLSNILARGNAEDIDTTNSLVQQINEIDLALKNARQGTEEYTSLLDEKQATITGLTDRLKELNTQILAQATLLQQVDLTDVTFAEGTSVDDIINGARQAYQSDLQRQVDTEQITQEQMQAIIESTTDTLIALAELTKVAENVPLEYIQKEVDRLKEEAKLLTETSQGVGWQSMDITTAEYNALQPQYEQLKAQLEAQGVDIEETEMVTLTKDGQIKDRKDWKIMQYLLQEILKTEQKQLDGMYNLPEGASFWIPYEAAKLIAKDTGEAIITNPEVISKPLITEEEIPVAPQELPEQVAPVEKEIIKIDEEPVKYQTYEEQMKAFRDWEERFPVKEQTTSEQLQKFRDWEDKTKPEGTGGFLGSISKLLTDMFMKLGLSPVGTGVGMGIGATSPQTTSNPNQTIPNLSTKLSLEIDNRTTINLDGRQLAMLLKRYLTEDLVRYSGNSSSRTVSVI